MAASGKAGGGGNNKVTPTLIWLRIYLKPQCYSSWTWKGSPHVTDKDLLIAMAARGKAGEANNNEAPPESAKTLFLEMAASSKA